MQSKEKLIELTKDPEFEDFMAQLERKLDTVTPLTESELKKAEEELKGMSDEEALATLNKMFNLDKMAPYRRRVPKFGRNEQCFCGSGKKYKNCCMEQFEVYISNMDDEDYNKIINNAKQTDTGSIDGESPSGGEEVLHD